MATQFFQPPVASPAWFHTMVERAAKADEPLMEIVDMTPALAAEILKNNPDNRSLRNSKMVQLANDIRAGRWVFNGEPIIISRNGLLNDGQHRANAVIEANVPIKVLMVFGLERSTRTTVDQGAGRTAGDYMQMDGVHNATVVASIGRWLIAYENFEGRGIGSSNYVSNGEIIARFAEDPLVARAARFASTMAKHCRRHATPQIIGFCFALFSRINAVEAETYMRQVCVGENIKKSDPAFAVREGLLRERLTSVMKVHIIFRGWNAFRQGRKLDLAKVAGNLPALL